MATPSKPIILKITDVGKRGALNTTGDAVNLSVNLTHVVIGSGRYTPTGKETKIKTLVAKISTASGEVDATNTLQFSATIYADKVTPVYELGLLTEDGTLFAIAAAINEPLFTLYPNVTFVVAFGLALNEASTDKVMVTINSNASLMPTIMQNHLAAPNPHPQYLGLEHLDITKDPHPQYLDFKRFQLLLDVLIPMGYLHHTHSAANPKPDFDRLLGVETAWRRLTGKIIVATDPADPFIKDVGLTIGQKGMTSDAEANRPHIYPLYTTNVFERYNPDDVIETVWQVSANKTSIDEGAAIRFTVTANNVPDGQILKWTVKEGALNSTSNDVTAPDATKSGSVILKNGSAIIDYTTTPDDNIAEAQKHVRLTVGAPANLSINIPINDTGHYETVIHISESTTNGIELAEYYNTQSGSYPSATETVRFIVDAGVDIIAPNTTTPAITEGTNWPSEAIAIIENHGRILGRGGDGGVPADYYLTRINNEGNFINPVISQSQRGGDGGTAVKGDMTIDNYGVIAGGGGGGGGAGFFRVSNESTGHIFIDQCHGGGAGGGAPLGRRYPNAKTYEQYWEKFEQSAPKYVVGIPKQGNLNYDAWTRLRLFGKDDNYYSSLRSVIFSGNPLKSDLVDIGDAYRHDLSTGVFSYVIPRYLDETETNYKVASWGDEPYAWIDMGMRQPTHATIEEKGVGGINLYSTNGDTYALNNLARSALNLDLSKNKGGDGGAIGENGEASLLGEFFSVGSGVQISSKRVTKSELLSIEEPNVGGLAGFVKEGGVTINNYSGGTTKGR